MAGQLCFFLVDENQSDRPGLELVFYHGYVTRGLKDMNVLTSADVLWQARDCNIKTLHSLLTLTFKRRIGKEIPAELRNYIVQMATEGTITREEAEKRRRELMEDRKIKPQSHQENRVSSRLATDLPESGFSDFVFTVLEGWGIFTL